MSDNNPLAIVNKVFLDSLEIAPLQKKLRKAVKDGLLPKLAGEALIEEALAESIINQDEADRLSKFDKCLMGIINVDDFDESELIRVAYPKENNNDAQSINSEIQQNSENKSKNRSWLKEAS